MSAVTETIAHHVVGTSGQWSADVRKSACRAFVDTIACAIAGRGEPAAQTASATFAAWPGGKATDIVSGRALAAPWAALVNGAAAHALDYDDVLETAAAHASAVFVPALLALGQERGSSGKQLVDALAIAFDVMDALAVSLNYAHYARGWHTTLTLGAPAATAGCARLIGLDVASTQIAISGSTSFSSGTRRQNGTQMKPMHAGIAAEAGILAASLAERGLTAAPEIFEGHWSFSELFGGPDMPGFAKFGERLAGRPAFADPGAWIKAYPCCASAHRPMDALADLQRAHGFAAKDIGSIEAYVSDIVYGNLMYERPTNEMQARFSLNHCLATIACGNGGRLADFSVAKLAELEVQSFWTKVKMVRDPKLPTTIKPGTGEERCRVVVTLTNGTSLEATTIFPKGHPEAPLIDDALAGKFRDCTADALRPAKSEELLERLFALDDEPDLAAVSALLTSVGQSLN